MIKNKICPNCNSDIHTYGIFTDENKIIIRCLNLYDNEYEIFETAII